MPTYERKCPSCGHEWEQKETVDGLLVEYFGCQILFNGNHRTAAQICPICSGHGCKRQISKTSFVLKGPGWGKDGYAK